LNEDEARQLVERPVQDFALRHEPAASRRVLAITRGHPALVQLLCDTIVTLKNEQPPASRRTVDLADVMAALPRALTQGAFFVFMSIEREVGPSGRASAHRNCYSTALCVMAIVKFGRFSPRNTPQPLENQ
jgi:hypothetical protein